MQPLEESDYYLANKLASAAGEEVLEQEHVVERLSQDSVVKALSEIPPQFRDVVVLVDIGDFTYADAAQILDVPIGTVMSRLHRGRRALKQHLAEETMA
jgi:RNA polymerase sigma-70 factor (ECF subfamily)